ncbi:MAG TPA: tetratricopeptide repeat protein, partial [Anaeromyxobacter sp.]
MSAPSLDEQIRSHLETLEAAPGDLRAFRALEALYEGASRWEDLVALYEGRARLVHEPGAPLLARAANLARAKLGNVARAEELYRRLLRTDPGHPEALRSVVDLLEERGDWPALAAAIGREAAAADDPKESAKATVRLAKLQEERLGRRDRAALLYARACRLDPTLEEARTRGLACFSALRRYRQAKRMLDAARDAGAEPRGLAAEYARLGAALVEEPLEHDVATDALIEATALDRSAPGVAAARERLRAFPRTWREEARALEEAAARTEDRREAARLHLRLAQLHLAYDPEGSARGLERIDRAWALAPGEPFALELLARIHAERGDHRAHADALARLAASTRDRAALVALWVELAAVDLIRFGDEPSALAALEKALELDPACESAALQAFEHHVDAGRFAEALSVLERHLAAAPEKPAHVPLRVRAAQLAKDRLGDPARARRHLEAALREDPADGAAAVALAPLLAEAGEWAPLAAVLEHSAALALDPQERVRHLERLAEVQQERLGKPREALRTLSRALALDPARAATRKAMEGAAARADAFLDLARAYHSAADAAGADLKTRKTLLRREAEILDRDLGKPEEAVRAWRALAELDPEDRGAAAALEACMARAGQQEELARELQARRARASGEERRALTAKLARLWHDAARFGPAAEVWRDALRAAPDDEEALWGLHAALEATEGARAAEERVQVLATLAARAKSPAERAALELARAEALLDPLGRPAEAAAAVLAVLAGVGHVPTQRTDAARLLEKLLERGVEPLRIAQALAPLYASAGETARQAAMLETIARNLPPSADPRERARHNLDASALRREKLADARGALSAAAAALRSCPEHADARKACEDLAREVGAHRELLGLLTEAARRLEARPDDEAAMRVRAAAVAEEDLGAFDEAAVQLRRALALRPGDPTVLAALTRAALASEQWVEAGELLGVRAAAAQGPEKVALLAQRAEVLGERVKDPAAAAAALREALAVAAPEQRARLLARLADALGNAGDDAGRADALGELAQATQDPAEAARAALEASRIAAGMGDARGASERAAAALAANPADAGALSAVEANLDAPDPEAVLAAAKALATHPDPRRRMRALEAEGRARPDAAGRAAALLASAKIAERELRQLSLAFTAVAEAVRLCPADAELRRELRRLGVESQELEACTRVQDELCAAAGPELRTALLRERADFVERRLDRDRAAEAWARVLEAAPGDREALAALRRLHRARERWGELAEVCAELARRASEPAARVDALREEAAIAEERLSDAARSAAAWAEVARLSPGDADARAALERLLERLDRPADLAAVLETRLAGAFDPEVAARLAELRRERLGDPAGALALHADLLRRDPRRVASRDALTALAATPGAVGREALEAADAALRAAREHAKRVAMREARLAAVEEPAERARLLSEIRTLLERDLGTADLAFIAACRAFAEGGPARAAVEEDLGRLARETGNEDELATVVEQAAAGALPAEALPHLRRAAQVRAGKGGPEAIEAWRRVLSLAPDDAEALETLERLYTAARSAAEILEVARRRAALGTPEERLAILLDAARLTEEAGDPSAALEAFRAAREADPAAEEPLLGLERLLSRAEPGAELVEVLGALAAAASVDPQRRLELRLRRAALVEAGTEPRSAIEAYADVLAESPREPDAVAGLERLLARPETSADAARVLEDVHRAAGDTRKLAALLEVRLETADAAERVGLLAEVSALQERLGDKAAAFRAKRRELEDAASRGEDAPNVRADLERLAAAAGAWSELARALEEALRAPLPRAAT